MMHFGRRWARASRLAFLALVGATACTDHDALTATAGPGPLDVPIGLEVSSASVRNGGRIAVAVKLNPADGTTAGVQGTLEFDPALLQYIGQSPQGTAIAVVNSQLATSGTLRFAAFNPNGVAGRVAVFVFAVNGGGYAGTIRYIHQAAATRTVSHVRWCRGCWRRASATDSRCPLIPSS
jgi:hypothetical protein